MSQNEAACPVCGCAATSSPDYEHLAVFYECPVCGRFEMKYLTGNSQLNRNHLSAYLTYHKFDPQKPDEYRYHTMLDKEYCDKYRQEFDQGKNICGCPVHMDAEMVENWYPKTFAERIDLILLYFGTHIPHIGQSIDFKFEELCSIFFVDRWEYNQSWIARKQNEYSYEMDYMSDYLSEQGLIVCSKHYLETDSMYKFNISLTPKGYARVDELQKNSAYGRSVLVAMSFQNTESLREAIRKGIQDAGYVAIFIDEVQHNDFITPELLKHIKDSKFIVVDLTHQNNGAYFEEGYAMGLGKPVIQLCKKGVQLHFDIAQKNTIIWETEDEIPERLYNRIKATIE